MQKGQCYDDVATMSSIKRGVATQIKSVNKNVLYTHCYGHALKLEVNDFIRKVEVLKHAWVMIKEVCNLVKNSPSREAKLKETHETTKDKNQNIRAFCPTH